jgi:hypothetical protein
VAVQVELRALRGTPVRRKLGKFPDDEGFDVRTAGLLVFEIRADVSDVRISEANDLACVAGVGENFLVTGEAGVENDFTAAARDGAGRAAVKDAPVFQRERRGSVLNFGQWFLP